MSSAFGGRERGHVRRLIQPNGPPGIGKSTLARRYGADHAGTLVLEIDRLRRMVSAWSDDPTVAGARVRSAALAGTTAYLAEGGRWSSRTSYPTRESSWIAPVATGRCRNGLRD